MEPRELFFESLVRRDFGRMRTAFAGDAQARFLLPRGLEEYSGGDSITRRVESWFGSASEFELTSSNGAAIGPRQRRSWSFEVVREPGRREVIEQVAFFDVGPAGIERLDLVCSGFQAAPGALESPTRVFDAGGMGCADGLAQEFRRQLGEVAVGDSLTVVVRDPAAKEDLPALARLLGQSVTSVEAHDDGRLAIKVERIK
jgi:tRNA 2-thiouridine synthesizing protein A